jgi:hypothetical protein
MLLATFVKKGRYTTHDGREALVSRIRMTPQGWILEGSVHIGENVWQLANWDSSGFSCAGVAYSLREACGRPAS